MSETKLEISEYHIVRIHETALEYPNAPLLESRLKTLINMGILHLVIDFSEVEIISSMGLGIMISIVKELQHLQGSLRLVGLQPDVFLVFHNTQLERAFSIYRTLEEAIA